MACPLGGVGNVGNADKKGAFPGVAPGEFGGVGLLTILGELGEAEAGLLFSETVNLRAGG